MKKYFRIIYKLINNHGYNKKVLQYVFTMNDYIIKRHKQSGGFESVETLKKIGNIGTISLESVINNEEYNKSYIAILKEINKLLERIIGD
jgi:hypothetical protein